MLKNKYWVCLFQVFWFLCDQERCLDHIAEYELLSLGIIGNQSSQIIRINQSEAQNLIYFLVLMKLLKFVWIQYKNTPFKLDNWHY